jgi:integrase
MWLSPTAKNNPNRLATNIPVDGARPAFAKFGIPGVGWHTFRHTVESMLAEMGERQLTIRDYLRHSNLNVTN